MVPNINLHKYERLGSWCAIWNGFCRFVHNNYLYHITYTALHLATYLMQ